MRFLKSFLASLFVLVFLVFLVFGTINPFGWFWGKSFLTTTPVTRARKQVLLAAWNRKQPVEGLVLGSSQSMKLDPELLSRVTGHRYFNFAVSSGKIEDAYALLDYVGERKLPITHIILNVDPWMFTPGDLPSELMDDWQLAPRVQDRRPTLLWTIGHGVRLIGETLTLSYARQVVTSIKATRQGREPLHTFLDNGYLEYRERDRQRAAGTYDLEGMMRRCSAGVMADTRKAHTFDAARFGYFTRTLDRARALGIGVTVWMPPRHPSLNASLDSVPAYRNWLAHAVDSVQLVSEAHGARFVDLTSIEKFGGDAEDWYDCFHFGAGNAARVAARLIQR